MGWNIADAIERLADADPDRPALVQGERLLRWADVDRRADALAADLLAAGLGQQAKVATYLQNCPEYLETYLAAFKAGLVPVNTNFRYGPAEIHYLFDNADAEAVVFGAEYAEVIDEVRPDLRVTRWYTVGDPVPDWARPYEEVVGRRAPRCTPPWGRSGDDLLLLYTGGTTGMPKGVMWRQDDLFEVLRARGNPLLGATPVTTLDEVVATANPLVSLPACPLMHGTGQFSSLIAWLLGGTVVLMPPGHFEAARLFDTVERHGVNAVVIVGDAFARPMLNALEAAPGRWDLSTVRLVTSSGVMWSEEVKAGLLRHLPPGALLFDSLGSSEGVGFGASVSSSEKTDSTARFSLGEFVKVVADDGHFVQPGSEERGLLALSGPIPLGYYKDPEKTAATFRVIDGRRYSIPGDYALVNADGTLQLLGRGSVCINTGGEKVFPEEVEEVLKRHPSVHDAVCVGVPDDRFGQAVAAIVELDDPAAPADPDELIALVRDALAHFKAPRHVVFIDSIGRAPNGKVDYRALTAYATDRTDAP